MTGQEIYQKIGQLLVDSGPFGAKKLLSEQRFFLKVMQENTSLIILMIQVS